ncbi:hypothetical protein F4680DRAFT_194828 [Xylaria scruposa]|nr:hypothetical protein F4680DRAFT_194828 [Xylaria scruposa]
MAMHLPIFSRPLVELWHRPPYAYQHSRLRHPITPSKILNKRLSELPPLVQSTYLPSNFRQLAGYWVILLLLSRVLGTILIENYSPTTPLPSRTWIEETEQDLVRRISQASERPNDACPAASFYFYHLQLSDSGHQSYYSSTSITQILSCQTSETRASPRTIAVPLDK